MVARIISTCADEGLLFCRIEVNSIDIDLDCGRRYQDVFDSADVSLPTKLKASCRAQYHSVMFDSDGL